MKRTLTLLLTALIVTVTINAGAAIIPVELGENQTLTYATDYSKAEDPVTTMVKAFGNGITSGDKLYGASVTEMPFADGTELSLLKDGYYGTYYEWHQLKSGNGTEPEAANADADTAKPYNMTGKMVKFTQENSGIEFSWETAQPVRRIHLWAWRVNSIDRYKVQYFNDIEGMWRTIKTGTLLQEITAPNDADSVLSGFYPIGFDPVITTKIRFVIDSFTDCSKGAYLVEAVPHNAEIINLQSLDSQIVDDEKHTANPSVATLVKNAPKSYTIYADEYKTMIGTTVYTSGETHMYPQQSANSYPKQPCTMVSFGDVRQKIGKIRFYLHSGSFTGYTVYTSDDKSLWDSTAPTNFDTPAPQGWTPVFSSNVTESGQGAREIDVSDVPAARYWMVKFNEGSSNLSRYWSFDSYNEPSNIEEVICNPNETSLLNDDFRLTYKEWRLLHDVDGLSYVDARPFRQKDKFVRLSAPNAAVSWRYDEPQSIKRLNLWVWPSYAIDDYEIRIYDPAAENWTKIKEGSLNPLGCDLGDIAGSNNTYFHSVVLDEEVFTDSLRFVIKSYTDNTYGAYIAEADIYDTNNINYAAVDAEGNDNCPYSIYFYNFKSSNTTQGSGYNAPVVENVSFRTWPSFTTGGMSNINITPDAEGNCWYAASFRGCCQPINRIGFNLAQNCFVTGFEVWCSNSSSAFENADTDADWTKVATVNGIISGTGSYIDIKDAPAAEYWKIKITDYTGVLKLTAPAMLYEMAENELNLNALNGGLAPGQVITCLLNQNDKFFEGKKNGEAQVIFGLYRDGSLIDANIVNVNLDLNGTNAALYTIPEDTSGSIALKAFIWNDVLQPLSLVLEK